MTQTTGAATFLVADDIPLMTELMRELLGEAGVCVTAVAYDGREALRLYQQFKPHAVVLDFEMPGATGLEVAGAIRSQPQGSECLIVIVSSHPEPALREQCLAAGADHFLNKADEIQRLVDIARDHDRHLRQRKNGGAEPSGFD